MIKNSKTNLKFIFAITCLLIIMFSTISLAIGSQATLDITPPRGKIQIQNMRQIDNINYVDSVNISFEISAIDDMCEPTEIKYHYSLSPISNVAEITTWYDYTPGKIENIALTNPSGNNAIYVIFKDKEGNISRIYDESDLKYTIKYNENANDAVMFGTTVQTKAYYGMPFIVTTQIPTREGYRFMGWSTSKNATEVNFKSGDIIPADTFVGGGKEINLYAVWSQSTEGAVLLADVVAIGDYVNYPVAYDNVGTKGADLVSNLSGWRVISKNVDLDGQPLEGAVNLISAGVPFTFKPLKLATSCSLLKNNFIDIEMDDSSSDKFHNTGFLYMSLKEIFTNKFTAMQEDGITPKVRTIIPEDIFSITGHTEMKTMTKMKLNDKKYDNLFVNGTYYYIVSDSNMWYIDGTGYIRSSTTGTYGIRPVVSLKPTVISLGKDAMGAWNIDVVG